MIKSNNESVFDRVWQGQNPSNTAATINNGQEYNTRNANEEPSQLKYPKNCTNEKLCNQIGNNRGVASLRRLHQDTKHTAQCHAMLNKI